MLSNRREKQSGGFTLLEILISVIVFAVAIVPIYFSLTWGAAKEIEVTKIAMARKILESFRQEIISQEFEKIEKLIPNKSTEFVEYKDEDLKKLNISLAASGVLNNQKSYKDFSLSAKFRFSQSNDQVIEIQAFVTWSEARAEKKQHKPEELSFLLVKP